MPLTPTLAPTVDEQQKRPNPSPEKESGKQETGARPKTRKTTLSVKAIADIFSQPSMIQPRTSNIATPLGKITV